MPNPLTDPNTVIKVGIQASILLSSLAWPDPSSLNNLNNSLQTKYVFINIKTGSAKSNDAGKRAGLVDRTKNKVINELTAAAPMSLFNKDASMFTFWLLLLV